MHYTFVKYWVKIALRLFYHRYEVRGLEHIPKEGGVIFAGNHQNAPMDAFNIICNCGREPYFATRGDLFQKDWMRRILLSFKMYPVYRLRDGRANMAQNAAAFEFFAEKLLKGGAVGIFPEGEGTYHHRLHPLRKGMARLAFRALEQQPDLPVYIVPVGLQYERKHDYQGDLLLQFGEPIRVNDFLPLYQKKKARALRQLTAVVSPCLSNLMIDIQDKDNYDAINGLRQQHYHASKEGLMQRFQQGKAIVEQPEAFESAPTSLSTWQWKFLLLFPITLLGFLFHFPLRKWFDYRSHRCIADTQFLATAKFIHGFLFFPLYYSILAIIIGIFVSPYGLILLPFLPLGGRWVYRLAKG